MDLTLEKTLRFLLLTAGLLVGSAAFSEHANFEAYSGEQIYQRFCAACHGENGEGDGPVAPSMNVLVPDLTYLAARRGGEFPEARIREIVDGRWALDPHGTRQMPVWGYQFWVAEGADDFAEADTMKIIRRLVDYLESIQKQESPVE